MRWRWGTREITVDFRPGSPDPAEAVYAGLARSVALGGTLSSLCELYPLPARRGTRSQVA